jgi:hypothetical protein
MDSISARPGSDPSKPRKNKRREEFPRRVSGLIAAAVRESRKTGLKTSQTGAIRAFLGRMGAILEQAMPCNATNGFAGRCLHDIRPGQGKKWQKRS